jgi:hypothetical protein
MKNIHVLKTDKPSRLYLDCKSKLQLAYIKYNQGSLSGCFNQNIYITSDEEIISFDEINSLSLRDGKDIQTNMSNI